MLSLGAHLSIFVGIFAAIVVLSMIGNASINLFLALLVALGFAMVPLCAMVPLMVKLVVAASVAVGNGTRPAVAWLSDQERAVVFFLWGLLAAGIFVVPQVVFRGLDFD